MGLYPNNVGEWVSKWVSQSMGPSELHVQKFGEHITAQSIAFSHVQLLYIVVYDYVLKYIDFGA